MAQTGPTGINNAGSVNPVSIGSMPGLLAGGLGSAMLTPEEQMTMLEGQRKVAMTPADVADTQARTAVNAAQAQMLTKQANKLGMQLPMPYRLPNGQMAYLTPAEMAEMEQKRVSSELDARKIAIDESLNPLRKELMAAQTAAQVQNTKESKAKIRDINQKLLAIEDLQERGLTGKLKDDIPSLIRIHPDVASTYVRSITNANMARKAKSVQDAYEKEYTRALMALNDPMSKDRMLTEAQKIAKAEQQAMAYVDKLYDEEGNPRAGIKSGEVVNTGPPQGKFKYW